MIITYIAHPYTTHGTPSENFIRVDAICKHILKNEPDIIPVSPLHAFQFCPVEGDQSQVIKMCLNLLSKCSAIRFYGPWQHSSGCLEEMTFAKAHQIPIQILSYPINI